MDEDVNSVPLFCGRTDGRTDRRTDKIRYVATAAYEYKMKGWVKCLVPILSASV